MTRFRRKSAALNLVRIIPVWHKQTKSNRILFAFYYDAAFGRGALAASVRRIVDGLALTLAGTETGVFSFVMEMLGKHPKKRPPAMGGDTEKFILCGGYTSIDFLRKFAIFSGDESR